MARKTGQWGMYNPNHRLTADSVSLDPRKIKKDFLKVLFVREEARRRFPKAPWISYEELVSNCAGSMARIQKRLGVQIKPLKPKTIKIGRPVRETVKNYDEIKEYFANTKFAGFFHD